ncbi:hypothetical protein [Roseovarius sp. 2305UL8-3]
MTNTLAIGLAALILLALGLDYMLFEWGNTVFLGRKLIELIEWLAFWR